MAKPLPPRPREPACLPAGHGSSVGRQPLWRGPLEDGITYSMLCKFLQCQERFRLLVVEGIREPRGFDKNIEFGSMFHAAEEAHCLGKPWLAALKAYYQSVLEKFPANEKEIGKWYLLCKDQFALYVTHWAKHETEVGHKTVLVEKSFKVPYRLSTGDTVTLRGKIDSVHDCRGFLWIRENKTKGDIDQEGIARTVDQNLQTMIYHLALRSFRHSIGLGGQSIAGTIYNVIRRPLSDRFAPRKGKKETDQQFYARVAAKTAEDPSKHFFRWIVAIRQQHIDRFQRECLDPILVNLVEWWESISQDPFNPFRDNSRHFRFPFGVYHSMERGYRGDAFDYFVTGNKNGLEKVTTLFPEL